MIIDADTHVDESESTWSGIPQELARYMPMTVVPYNSPLSDGPSPSRSRWWLVEGRLQARAVRDDINHPPRERRELEDVPGRLRHMDEMGVDVQVVFPTFFIRFGSENPDCEWALATTYNRWMAERCANTNGRLRWACVLPWLQPEKAVAELRWAKENGCCGIYKRGFDLERPVGDSHFYPVYEEANALDVPLCIHTGHPLPGREWDRGFPVIASLNSLLNTKLPSKFPRLRFGLIEAGASWLPYTLSGRLALQRQQQRGKSAWPSLVDYDNDLLKSNRIYVTIDPVDDIQYLLNFGTDDSLMLGTDYSHSDVSANVNAFNDIRALAKTGRISESIVEKILDRNPSKFYGF